MEKKEFVFNQPELKIVEINGQEITVRPFLSLAEQLALINNYIDTYFTPDENNISKDEYNLWGAEYALKLAIVDFCSSIEIKGAFENLLYGKGYQEIENAIVNYWDFRELLDETVKNIKSQIIQKNSLASLVEKAGLILNDLGESMKNFKPEDLNKLKEAGKELISSINESPIAKEVFADSERGK